MRCLFDTKVYVSALLSPGSQPRQAIDKALRQGRILLSYACLAELSEVLGRKQLRRYIDIEDARLFLSALTREAEWVEIQEEVVACRDPKDDKFLSLAIAGHATHIISGDADLLSLHPFRGIPILSPADFLRTE